MREFGRTCKYHRTEELTFTQHLALYQALYMLSHVVFTKMDVSSILQIKAAETQKLRSLRKVSHPPQEGQVEAEKRISVPKSSCPCCHILAGFTAGWKLGGKTNHGTAGVTWQPGKARGLLFHVAWYLSSHCATTPLLRAPVSWLLGHLPRSLVSQSDPGSVAAFWS